MRRAFFIIGPESSGTRMLTESFVKLGAYGGNGHFQELDTMAFFDKPDFLVFRRSVPHAGDYPPIVDICRLMLGAGYEVIPVVIDRKNKYLALSQVKRGHADTGQDARRNIFTARLHINDQLKDLGIAPVRVKYVKFVTNAGVRKRFFRRFNLSEPAMSYYNANEAYE